MKHLKIYEKFDEQNFHNVCYKIVELIKDVYYLIDCKTYDNIKHYWQSSSCRTVSIIFKYIEEETIEYVKKIQSDLNLPKWYLNNSMYSFDITDQNVDFILNKLELLSSANKYNV
jgi:hypothetical protein